MADRGGVVLERVYNYYHETVILWKINIKFITLNIQKLLHLITS